MRSLCVTHSDTLVREWRADVFTALMRKGHGAFNTLLDDCWRDSHLTFHLIAI